MSEILELTDENFDTKLKNIDKPVLVEFFAPWCGHCRTQATILESLAKELDNAVIAKINVDENRTLASKFFISGIPAILLFKDGKLLVQKAGVHQKDELKNLITKYI